MTFKGEKSSESNSKVIAKRVKSNSKVTPKRPKSNRKEIKFDKVEDIFNKNNVIFQRRGF